MIRSQQGAHVIGLLSCFIAFLPASLVSAAQYSVSTVTEDGVKVVRLEDKSSRTSVWVAPSVGNIAFRMLVNGKNILWFPFKTVAEFKAKPQLCGIPLLAPWADRLDEAAFYANGKRYSFNLSLGNLHFDQAGHPIHGFLSFASDWEVVKTKENSHGARLTSRLDVFRRADWMAQFPFAHVIEITYTLADGVLEVHTRITNKSVDPMPLSIGYHSFYQISDTPRKNWTVSLGAATEWPSNHDLLPRGDTRRLQELVAHPEHFVLGDLSFDNVLADLIRDREGRAVFVVAGRQQRIEVLYGPKFRAGEIWVPPGRDFLCFEPMVGINNAMNLAHRGIYKELSSIPPGGVWAESFWIRPTGF
jgi:aldose 1-epimerase